MSSTTEAKPSGPRPRIEGLSDLIFGLALSIGAIQLVGTPPQSDAQLISALSAFAFSFFILISVWNRYTSIASVVPVETTLMIRLNMLLLFLVVVEPYLFNLLVIQGTATSPVGPEVSAIYGLDLGGMNFVLAYFTHILTCEEKKLIPRELIRKYAFRRDMLLIVGLIFAVSAIPIFWTISLYGVPLRILLWFLTIPVFWLANILRR